MIELLTLAPCIALLALACSERRLLVILNEADSGQPQIAVDAGGKPDAALLDAGSTPDAGGKPCALDDSPCTSGNHCCSETCYDEGSGQMCLKRSPCHPSQDRCISGEDCCSGVCDEGFCAKVWLGLCRIIGEPCYSNLDCCSSACADTGHGSSTCQALSGCHPIQEVCSRGSDCCSGRCEMEASGVGSCRPEGDCARPGDLCGPGPFGPRPGCCESWQNGPGDRALCVITDTGTSRCMIQTGCDPPGSRCRLPEQCCSDTGSGNAYCVPDSRGDLVCDTRCVPQNGTCVAARDCCTGLCVNGTCKESGVSCKQLGIGCTQGSDCCSGYCEGHGGTVCSAPPSDSDPPPP